MTRPLTEAQQAYARRGTGSMKKTNLRRAQQIASQRRFTYEREPLVCRRCGRPRESPRSNPICEECS